MFFDYNNLVFQKGYGILNLNVAWTEPSGKVTFSVYGRNALDQKYRMSVLQTIFGYTQTWGNPSEFGGQISYAF